jgi:predicted nucleic acid-binding protein
VTVWSPRAMRDRFPVAPGAAVIFDAAANRATVLMANFPVVLDACVLYPASLRDTLLRAAERGLYMPHWSGEILEEMRRNLIGEAKGKMTPDQWEHLKGAMTLAFPDAVVNGYESLVASMTNEPKDRHVVAAAVRVHAEVIVTANLRDFPEVALAPHGIEPKSPDEFLCDLTSISSTVMATILREQLSDITHRLPDATEATMDRLLQTLTKLGAPNFVETIRAVLEATDP